MTAAKLTELRLKAFKSFKDQILPISEVTVVTGRNSSGKSNALDALEVLSRLATGEDIADALDGRRREGGPIRGGSQGCAPHGGLSFSLGCDVVVGEDKYEFDVRVRVRPEIRVMFERLVGPGPALESGHVEQRDLLKTRSLERGAPGINAEVFNGKRGNNPVVTFRDTRLVTTQISRRLDVITPADAAVIRGSEAVLSALTGLFHLDPIPHLMRDFVSERDSDLRRSAENLSAAIARLRLNDRKTFERIVLLVKEVADERIRSITTVRSDLGDVMLALQEGPRKADLTPAREMSDGLLRFVAIATALLTSNRGLDIESSVSTRPGSKITSGVTVVIEELENGLHPSQADRVLRLILEASEVLATQVLVTTHSPALLNAMSGILNERVFVCYRRPEDGMSMLECMTNLDGYERAMASGPIGDVVSRGRLAAPESQDGRDFSAFNRLLGIE